MPDLPNSVHWIKSSPEEQEFEFLTSARYSQLINQNRYNCNTFKHNLKKYFLNELKNCNNSY